ncbi:MAG TPA: FAD-dependent oxidoreductase [Vicinamibacterales bacterium]|nr:FAD-dependent oxidoreductase [Vicinamibacterales bacterium]
MPRSTSLWVQTTGRIHGEPLRADAAADVCVVGAGIAGVTTAYLLAREGRSVILIDEGDAGAGQTAMTTAHLSDAIDDTYQEIVRLHGRDHGRRAADSHRTAIDSIEAICRDERIDCGFERVSGYLFLADGGRTRDLEQEQEAARSCGVDAERLARAPVRGFDTGCCLHFPRQGQFHPLKYLEGVAGALVRRGGRLHTGVRAVRIEGSTSAARIETAGGPVVTARAVVVATNSPINDLIAIHGKQAPYQTYAIGARVAPDAITHALYWDTADPYHYVRLQRTTNRALGGDNDEALDILIVGGEDHKTGQASDADARFDRLEDWMRNRFAAAGAVVFRWSGQVMETFDGLAFIGRNPLDYDNVFIATGDSGMGITHGTIAGMLLSDLIAGRTNPWAAVYDPSRMRTASLTHVVKENLNVAAQYTAWFTRGDVDSVDQITPGNGAIVVDKGLKLAVFRDETGLLHRKSAVCPHLGCIVAWNPAASTWDCPCHGSRFDALGHVINGPSSVDLRDA